MLEERSGIPVVGVAPYLQIEVEDEDSLTERFDSQQEVGQIDIAVIRVPRISNFTDFNPFENIPGVSLRYVKHIHELKYPDMVILPGTKNTMGDLQWMRESGMEAAVPQLAAAGTVIFGICGGHQMLRGNPFRSGWRGSGWNHEGTGTASNGYRICRRKDQNQSQWYIRTGRRANFPSFPAWSWPGYEIHMGVTTLHEGASPLTTIRDHAKTTEEKQDGAYTSRVYGTYVHGVFDKEKVWRRL